MTKCLRKLCPKAPSTCTPMARPRKLKSATDTGRLSSVSWPTVRDGNWLFTRVIFPAAPRPCWFSPRGSAKASANSLETTVDPAPVSSTNEYGPCPSTNTGSKISACLLPASRNVTHASGRVCISALSFRFLSLSPQRRRRGVPRLGRRNLGRQVLAFLRAVARDPFAVLRKLSSAVSSHGYAAETLRQLLLSPNCTQKLPSGIERVNVCLDP